MSAHRIRRVVLWMTGTLLSFSTLALSIRGLAGALSIFEVLSVRALGALAVLFALAAARPELRPSMKPRRMGLNLVRNGVHYAAQYLWALSLTLLPLATVFALEFTMPIWLTFIAVLFLGEKLTPSRIGVVVLGFAGALVVLHPGVVAFQPASLLVLCAALGYAIFYALTKKLTATESTFGLVFWMNVIHLPLALAGSDPLFFLKLGSEHVPSVVGIGVAGLSAHYCLTNAFRAGDATLVVPLDFLRVPLIAVVGWWCFGEELDPFVILGSAIILAGVVWNLRDAARSRAQQPL